MSAMSMRTRRFLLSRLTYRGLLPVLFLFFFLSDVLRTIGAWRSPGRGERA